MLTVSSIHTSTTPLRVTTDMDAMEEDMCDHRQI